MKGFLDIAIPFITFFLMFVVGLDVTIRDFYEALKRPVGLAIGIVVQVILLPAIAIVIILTMKLPVHIEAGILLIAACPAGGISNYYCVLARSNIAMSIVLTVGTCILAVITLPTSMWIYEIVLGQAMNFSVPIKLLFGQLVIMVFIPVIIGMALRHYRPEVVEGSKKALSLGGVIALAGLVAFVVVQQPGEILAALSSSIAPAIVFTIVAMAAGLITGRACQVDIQTQFSLAIEFSVRNIAIAAAIAITLLGQVEFAIFAAAYFLIQLPIILIAVVFFRTYVSRISKRPIEERI